MLDRETRKLIMKIVGNAKYDITPYPQRPRCVALANGSAVTAPRREDASGTVNLSLADPLIPEFATLSKIIKPASEKRTRA